LRAEVERLVVLWSSKLWIWRFCTEKRVTDERSWDRQDCAVGVDRRRHRGWLDPQPGLYGVGLGPSPGVALDPTPRQRDPPNVGSPSGDLHIGNLVLDNHIRTLYSFVTSSKDADILIGLALLC